MKLLSLGNKRLEANYMLECRDDMVLNLYYTIIVTFRIPEFFHEY